MQPRQFLLLLPAGLLLGLASSCSRSPSPPTAEPAPAALGIGLAAPIPLEESAAAIPALGAYLDEVKTALASDRPVVGVEAAAAADPARRDAVTLALADLRFARDFVHRDTGEPLHNEILRADPDPAAGGQIRVELYNYFYNYSTVAWVDSAAKKVARVEEISATPPVVSPRLEALATQLALRHPDIRRELGLADGDDGAGIKVTVEVSQSERSRHLCAAPVFHHKGLALWTLVDLADWQVIGWQWTTLENGRPSLKVTERSLQNDAIMEAYCDTDRKLARDGWDITYRLTRSDGLEIVNVAFQGKPVLRSAKLVEWHVSYLFNNGFGYTDAMGCPMFSSSKVVAFRGPEQAGIPATETLKGGFVLVQDFRSAVWPVACNYRYQNRYEFYADGRFRICGANLGRGCQPGVWYRPVFRIELAQESGSRFEQSDGAAWKPWEKEAWFLQEDATPRTAANVLFRLHTGGGRGYEVEPSWGQFGPGSRSDNAYTYVTVDHPKSAEGAEDLPNLGDCCNSDHRQGPDQFIGAAPESLAGEKLIFWYVPQFQGDATPGKQYAWAELMVENGKAKNMFWPAFVGPMFIPFAAP